MVICLERGAYNLHMVQLMPLPLLAPVKSRMVYLYATGLPKLSWKKGHETDVIALVVTDIFSCVNFYNLTLASQV